MSPQWRDKFGAPRFDATALPVECWCRRMVVQVPQVEVMACRTRSCGSKRCKEGV